MAAMIFLLRVLNVQLMQESASSYHHMWPHIVEGRKYADFDPKLV